VFHAGACKLNAPGRWKFRKPGPQTLVSGPNHPISFRDCR
jgi:hypothetical protein